MDNQNRFFRMEKPKECILCCENFDEENPLQCGHWMHIACVQKHFEPNCPVCRQPLNIKVFGKKPQADMDLFTPGETREPDVYVPGEFDEEVTGNEVIYTLRIPRGILGNVIEKNFDDSEEEWEDQKTWQKKGYQYPEEDSDYDEENPRRDEWEYEDV